MTADVELKKKIIQLLKEDEEFRYVVAGVIGLDQILTDTKEIKERLIALEERQTALEERQTALEERQTALEERIISLEERVVRVEEEITKIWNELKEFKQMVNQRFEAIDQRFEAMQRSIDRIDQTSQENRTLLLKMQASLMAMEGKTGPDLENLILEVMRETIRLQGGVDPEKIRKIYMKDDQGAVYSPGYQTDIDVYLENGKCYLVEVKVTADNRDAWDLTRKARLYEIIHRQKPDDLFLIALRMSKKNLEYARSLQIKPITGEIID